MNKLVHPLFTLKPLVDALFAPTREQANKRIAIVIYFFSHTPVSGTYPYFSNSFANILVQLFT